jgi:hypothetical protein
MNIWSKLGISVALVAAYCIAIAELLQPTRFYERHKWSICATAIISGAIAYGVGRYVLRRIHTRYLEAQAKLPEAERDSDSKQWEPFLLFNLAYWGVMIAIFGCIIIFFVPTHSKRQKATVAARASERPARKAQPAPAAATTNAIPPPPPIPRFRLQGITLREPNPSALIDGRTYFIGDMVKDAKVVSIDASTVVLEWRDIKVTLYPPR